MSEPSELPENLSVVATTPLSSLPTDDLVTTKPMDVLEFTDLSVDEPRLPSIHEPPNVPIDGPQRWYLGVAESFAWWVGTLGVHLVAGITVVVGLIVFRVVSGVAQATDIQDPVSMLVVTGGEMAIFVLVTILAVSLRYWGRTFDELNLRRPSSLHVWMVICGTLPLTFCVSAWSIPIQIGWQGVLESCPQLKFFDSMNSMTAVTKMAQNSPILWMILIVSVFPAIGEELIFRGAIGRVLIAHLGVWSGVIITSILFGLIHIHPVHALSVIPLGLAMHLIYLWTRSFWMPMLLHFLNNSWATVAARWANIEPIGRDRSLTAIEALQMVTAVIAVIAIGISLWQSRVRYLQSDGSEWKSIRFPIRVPASSDIRCEAGVVNVAYFRTAIVSAIVCHIAVAIDLILSTNKAAL